MLGVVPTCTGQAISTPCASNLDLSPRPFFFCKLTGSGGASIIGPAQIATAQQILYPITNDVLGVAVTLECKFEEKVASEFVTLLGVSDKAAIDGETANLSVVHYVPGVDASTPDAATLDSSGLLLKYSGQPAGDKIRFSFTTSTQNPTANPTPFFALSHGFSVLGGAGELFWIGQNAGCDVWGDYTATNHACRTIDLPGSTLCLLCVLVLVVAVAFRRRFFPDI